MTDREFDDACAISDERDRLRLRVDELEAELARVLADCCRQYNAIADELAGVRLMAGNDMTGRAQARHAESERLMAMAVANFRDGTSISPMAMRDVALDIRAQGQRDRMAASELYGVETIPAGNATNDTGPRESGKTEER